MPQKYIVIPYIYFHKYIFIYQCLVFRRWFLSVHELMKCKKGKIRKKNQTDKVSGTRYELELCLSWVNQSQFRK